MTLVYDNVRKKEAQVHVLAIGVGNYPYLRGGARRLTERHMGLGQLTSSTISARYFCDWFLGEYDNPGRALGSVELLLSEAEHKPYVLPKGGSEVAVEPARIAAVRRAFDRWYKRCTSHPDNIAVFYFCGHGVQIGETYLLLLEDYGAQDHAAFRGSINFNQTWRGASGEIPGHKFFFADACSNVPADDRAISEASDSSLISTNNPFRYWEKLTVVRAAVEGTSAFGQEDKPSRFVQALVDCLRERAAIQQNNRWEVTNQSLPLPLFRAMNEINEAEGGTAQVHSIITNQGDALLQVPAATPRVPVVIEFDPSDAIDVVQLILESIEITDWKLVYPTPDGSSRPINSRWMAGRIPSGFYRLGAQFQNKPYKAITNKLLALSPPGPIPSAPIELEVVP